MANTIRIKRRASSGSAGAPTALKNGELAYNENDNTLYYGYGDDGSGNATSIPAIGGSTSSTAFDSAFVTIDTTQTVTGNKTLSGTTTASGTLNVSGTFQLGGSAVTSTAAELNLLDGVSGLVKADFTKLAAVNASAAELNILDGVTATTAELNKLDGVTSTTAELNILDGVTADATELNILEGALVTTAELNILDGVTATASEINILDGVTATTAELNFVDGVTSGIQDQIDGKQDTLTFGIADDNTVQIDDADAASGDYAKFTGSGLEGRSTSEVISDLGAVTSVAAGSLIDVSVSGSTSTVNVDLSELTDMTETIVGTDEFVVLDASSQKRKAASEIPLSIFNNDLTDNNTTYDLTVPASTTDIRLAGSDSTNDDITITGGTNVTVTRTSSSELTIASSFTNTTYTAESNGGLVLDGTAFRLDADNMAVHTGNDSNDAFTIHPGGSGGYEKPKSRQIDTFPISAFKTDVDTSITSTGTLTDLTVTGDVTVSTGDVVITAGNLVGPSTFYIDPAPNDSPHDENSPAATGTVVIRGDLQVDGTTTTINSTEITIEDSTFTIASGTSGLANLDETGIHFGANDEIKFEYDHTNTTMVLNQALQITGDLDGATIDGGTF